MKTEHRAGPNGEWSIDIIDDGCNGFEWAASRTGVVWSKGWFRTSSRAQALLWAKQTALGQYGAELLRAA